MSGDENEIAEITAHLTEVTSDLSDITSTVPEVTASHVEDYTTLPVTQIKHEYPYEYYPGEYPVEYPANGYNR